MNGIRRLMALGTLAALAACGGGDGQLSGTITGLTADGLSLSDGTDTLTNIASGTTSFTFPTLLLDGATYNVTVTTQPNGLFCTVANGSGTVSSSTPSANITVTCSASFNVSGTISGLTGSGLVISDGTENITISPISTGQQTFAFPTLLANGVTYTMSVVTQPKNPTQNCSFGTGVITGVVDGAPISGLSLTCR